ncbi:MAG: hypothetical protein IJP86_10415 [Synergistaceae bacterium]|nr:hypothetical protein [Synergistaceae bacterium]
MSDSWAAGGLLTGAKFGGLCGVLRLMSYNIPHPQINTEGTYHHEHHET